MNKVKGFTLIEIVVVIVLIGILSAVALPRFYDFTTEAADAAANGVAASLNSSVGMLQASWEISGKSSNVEGFRMNSRGLPQGVGDNPDELDVGACTALINALLSTTSTVGDRFAFYSGDSDAGEADGQSGDGDRCYLVNMSLNEGVLQEEQAVPVVVFDRSTGTASVRSLSKAASESAGDGEG